MNPKVTVLMPVYNGAAYLTEAIGSVLAQDFTDFEFLIINDGSTDTSARIVESFSDPRIRLLHNEKNIGLVNTLNRGLTEARGEYIARMDCDDICLRTRLSAQVRFLEKNRSVGACGGFYYQLKNNKKALVEFPVTDEEIRAYMVFNSPMPHPTVMMRSALLQEHNLRYSPEFIHCEDYDLWSKISEYSSLANCPEVLLEYRVHAGQITGNQQFQEAKLMSLDLLRERQLERIGISPSPEELRIHHLISNGDQPDSPETMKLAEQWLEKLVTVNDRNRIVSSAYFGKIILERWLRLCYNHSGWKKGFRHFYRSSVYKRIKLPVSLKLALFREIYYSYKRKKQR